VDGGRSGRVDLAVGAGPHVVTPVVDDEVAAKEPAVEELGVVVNQERTTALVDALQLLHPAWEEVNGEPSVPQVEFLPGDLELLDVDQPQLEPELPAKVVEQLPLVDVAVPRIGVAGEDALEIPALHLEQVALPVEGGEEKEFPLVAHRQGLY